jgi:predicted SAM-dependent methyltransferase
MHKDAMDALRMVVRAYEGMDPAPLYVHRARKVLERLAFVERGDPRVAELVAGARERWGRVKVDVGSGLQPRGEDYLTVDAMAGETVKRQTKVDQGDGTMADAVVELEIKADLRAEMWALPFEDGQVDEIWNSHALEHAPRGRVVDALKEFHRVLRPGGRLIVTVPHFDYVAKYWLLGANRDWAEAMVFGMQDSEGEYHRCAFNAELLRGDLVGCGFEVRVLKIVWTHGQECLQAVALKAAA